MTKEWKDFPDNNLQSAKKILINSIENYKLSVRQLYYAKNMYYSEAIENDIEAYGQAKLDLVEVRNLINGLEESVGINREIIAETDRYHNWHAELEYGYKKWIGDFDVFFSAINVLYQDDQGNIDANNFADKIDDININVIDKMLMHYFPNEDLEIVKKDIEDKIEESDFDFSTSYEIPEWLLSENGEDLTTEKMYELLVKEIDRQIEEEMNGNSEYIEIPYILITKSVAKGILVVTNWIGSQVNTVKSQLNDFYFWATSTATAVIPELTEVFEKYGVPINANERQAMHNAKFMMEVLSDIVKTCFLSHGKLITKPSLLFGAILMNGSLPLLTEIITIDGELTKMLNTIDEFNAVLEDNLKIPDDLDERKDQAQKQLDKDQQELKVLESQKNELENIVTNSKSDELFNSMNNWNRTFENEFNDYLNINNQERKLIIDGTKYYQKVFNDTKEMSIINNYHINRYIELYGLTSEIKFHKEIIEKINKFIMEE